jgi:hypothetical protein
MRRTTTKVVSFAVVLLASLAGASPALAASPWWHLTSTSRPAYLHSGLARDEVQELTVTATEGTFRVIGAFEGVPKAATFAFNAEASVVQTGLEEVYGGGAVQVTGGPGDPTGAHPYRITFVGALADQAVKLQATAGGLEGGTATVSEVAAGRSDGELVLTAENLGDAPINGVAAPVHITDTLPPGLEAVAIAGSSPLEGSISSFSPLSCSLGAAPTCTFSGSLAPFDQLEVRVAVNVKPAAASGELNQGAVSGGEAQEARAGHPITVSSSPSPFGVEDYELVNEEEGGAPTLQAGAHPFQQTTTIVLNQGTDRSPVENEANKPIVEPAGLAKDLAFKWPPGLIGNPTVFPRCALGAFLRIVGSINECPADTAVGVATVSIFVPGSLGYATVALPLFNLEPLRGEPARLGFYVVPGNAPVFIEPSLRSGSDYGITVSSFNIAQTVGFLSAQVAVWGTPGDPRHDNARGWGCLGVARGRKGEGACNAAEQQHPPPFLSLPTSCAGPLQSVLEGDPWTQPGPLSALATAAMPSLDGCNRLPFSAEIKVSPDGQAASTPTGLLVNVHVPQGGTLNATGLANSNIKSIKVTLPEGVILNPAAADGLQACPEGLVGFQGFQEFGAGGPTATFSPKLPNPLEQGLNFCPDAAKVATVNIKTPLLPAGEPLEGSVYLATPAPNGEEGNNPFNSTVAMYIVAEDPVSGSLVKLPGKVTLNQSTGRIESTFENTPQLAFEDAEIHFFGGERAPLATPAHCGTYTTEATFTPWSGTEPVKSTSSFQVTSGPNGTPCPPAALPFSPSLDALMTDPKAGEFSPLSTTISRADGNQNIQTVQLHMPPGLSGILSGVKLCPEAQANAGTCGPESLIGHTIVSVGLGGDPFSVTGGEVFLTEKYGGGQFGLSIVNPAVAGPFNLGKVVVRAKIEVDPHTAALTITTGAIPHILDGFPLQIKHVNVTIDRPGFTFNPTNCSPMAVTGTIGSVEGASSPVSEHFEVTNCAKLKFQPKVSVTTAAHSSKANGASLVFKISYPKGAMGSQAWFNEAKVDLPKQLPARLTTIQKACLAATFEHDRGACPAAAVIGHAVVHTPVLPVALEGPVYFVSYGGAAFPDAVLVLDGYGVHIELHGNTFINGKTSITSATFRNTPDVPFESIEVTIPSGKFGEFGAYLPASAKGSFCGQKLVMPTLFKAQNGLEIHQNTPVGVTGCPKAKTRAQLLAAALKACHRDRNKAKRKRCEATAHRKYAPPKKKK